MANAARGKMFASDNDPFPDAHSRRYRIRGRFDCALFAAFTRQRAALLALRVVSLRTGPGLVEALVAGEPALLGMFEMACALGPGNCIVDDMTSEACESDRCL
jgi:acylphosphatase